MSLSEPSFQAKLEELRAKLLLEEICLPLKGRTWHLTVAPDQDAMMELVEELDKIPYGFLLWESAIGLAYYIEAHPEMVQGKRLLELGAGLGFAGLVARSVGAQVWQTDHLHGVLAIADYNAQKNGIQDIERFVADWRTWENKEQYDVLLGADILYERQMQPYLETIFCQALAPDGVLILADPQRAQAFHFITQLENGGWQFALETVKVPKEGVLGAEEMDIALYIGRR